MFAIVASLLTADIIDRKEQQRTINNQLSNLSNVYIGCSKQWTDESFGCPQFVGQKEDYRKNNYPNSYGVSTLNTDITNLLFSYDWFNSQQLKNKLDNIDLD